MLVVNELSLSWLGPGEVTWRYGDGSRSEIDLRKNCISLGEKPFVFKYPNSKHRDGVQWGSRQTVNEHFLKQSPSVKQSPTTLGRQTLYLKSHSLIVSTTEEAECELSSNCQQKMSVPSLTPDVSLICPVV